MRVLPTTLAVGAGGALGGLLRYAVTAAWPVAAGGAWPTLVVNLAGSFAIALYWSLTGPEGRLLVAPHTRMMFMTGFCGSLTTFSMFAVQVQAGIRSGDWRWLACWVPVSVIGWLAAAALGLALGRVVNRSRT